MNLSEKLKWFRKPSKAGRKMIKFETREAAWNFWHRNSTASTLTSRPARLRVADKPRVQESLKFVQTTRQVSVRNKPYFESIHFTVTETMKNLFRKFLTENPDHNISYGTFLSLKPFYVRAAGTKDFEMCVCKKHLHARRSIDALIKVCEKQLIVLDEINDYYSFFNYMNRECTDCETAGYISWECVKEKDKLCKHVSPRWEALSQRILSEHDPNTTVKFEHFVKVEVVTKKGKAVERLAAVSIMANAEFLVDFISKMLAKIQFHRNHLKHYRSTLPILRQWFADSNHLDVDYSENLKIPVKYEPQSLHWSHTQVTVHSGILKTPMCKSYHPYISNDRKHDQAFAQVCIEKMIENIPVEFKDRPIIIESDNCTAQYKSVTHFWLIQDLAKRLDTTIVRVYGIAEHGKGEVDHVGGVAKTSVRREVANGSLFINAGDIVSFLQNKFEEKESPRYVIDEITDQAERLRNICRLKNFSSIEGSSKFQVMVFRPNNPKILAAERICICSECEESYGSCSLFKEYEMVVGDLNHTSLRSDGALIQNEKVRVTSDFIIPGTVCAIAASDNSSDTVWFVLISSDEMSSNDVTTDDYGHSIPQGEEYFKGHYLEKHSSKRSADYYQATNKISLISKASVVYPFVDFEKNNKDLVIITNVELCQIIAFVEHYEFTE
ncbi:uncharacterized protein [Clytia hemisphaerica]|uniref:uncharacterized protein n=1 Tax=Clytia hemisphaerica TaxID=252671 RepID=UPI0034D731CB